MARKATWFNLAAALVLLFTILPAAGPTVAQGDSRTFPETGKTVKGKFLTYWNTHGALPQQGYPISDEMQEVSETNGKTYTVQYFERAVFEMHPENQAPYDVLLSLLGNNYLKRRHPNGIADQKASTDNAIKFSQTNHSLGGVFRKYWEANGGLAQQGYPITDEFQERSDLNGKTYNVQYFERAVFEYHPENKAPYDVLLSQLGTFQYKRKYAASGAPITVGMLTDTSGSLAIYGPMLTRGFELGLNYATDGTNKVMGHQINVITKDTASDVNTGTTAARELIEKERAQVLVGVPSSAVALAVSDLANKNKIIYLSTPAATPDLTGKAWNPYTFRASRTSVQDAMTMGAGLVQLGKKFVQLAPDYAFGRGSAAAFYAVVKGYGGTFPIKDNDTDVGTVFAPLDTTDFTPYINQILDSGAEVLIVTWAGTGFTKMFQQMQQLGVFDQMIVATGMGDNQTMKAGYAEALNSTGVSVYQYSLYDNPVNNWLTAQHKAKYGVPPDLFTAEGFLAAQMLVRTLEATGGDTSADKMIPVLEGMKIDGPKGTYTVRPGDHVLLQPMAFVKLVSTTDPDYKFFKLIKLFTPEEMAPPCTVPAALNRCGK